MNGHRVLRVGIFSPRNRGRHILHLFPSPKAYIRKAAGSQGEEPGTLASLSPISGLATAGPASSGGTGCLQDCHRPEGMLRARVHVCMSNIVLCSTEEGSAEKEQVSSITETNQHLGHLCPGAMLWNQRAHRLINQKAGQVLARPLPNSEVADNSLIIYETETEVLALHMASLHCKSETMYRHSVTCSMSDTRIRSLLWQAAVAPAEPTVRSRDQTT